MKKGFAAFAALTVLLSLLLCGCGNNTGTTPTAMPTATPAVTATVAPMLSPDPEDGKVTDDDGILGDEPEETKMPDAGAEKRR